MDTATLVVEKLAGQTSLPLTTLSGLSGLDVNKLGLTPINGTNYHFKVLSSAPELSKAFNLRYEVFCVEKGIVDPKNYPTQMETDEYDDRSLHVGVFEGDEMIAYARLVLPCEMFPIERTNTLPKCFDREKTIESSRGLVVKEHRHSDVIWHMSNSIYEFCRENGFRHILSFSNAIMYNGYKKRDFPFEHVGDAVTFHGHKSFPLVIKVVENKLDFTRKQAPTIH